MSFTIQIVHAKEFVRVIPDGDLDLQAATEMLLAAVSKTSPAGNYDVLVDCRSAAIHITLTDVTKVVEAMARDNVFFNRKLAVLPPESEGYKAMKFMEIYSSNRRIQIKVFDVYEEAINWLMPAATIPSG